MNLNHLETLLIYNNKKVETVGEGGLLTISWQLVTECQYRCSYCYFKPYNSSIKYENIMDLILFKIRSIQEEFEICLLGGEPTLHERFHYIVEELFKIPNLKKIDIISNLSKDAAFWISLIPYSEKLNLVFSFHLEYSDSSFFQKIKELKDFFSIRIVFVVHSERRFLEKMQAATDVYFDLLAKDVSINFLKIFDVNNGGNFKAYDTEVEHFLFEISKRAEAKVESIKLTYEDKTTERVDQLTFINKNLNRFKGWTCSMNDIIIKPEGRVLFPCTLEEKHIAQVTFKKRIIRCPLDVCACEGYWGYYKTPKKDVI